MTPRGIVCCICVVAMLRNDDNICDGGEGICGYNMCNGERNAELPPENICGIRGSDRIPHSGRSALPGAGESEVDSDGANKG